MSQRPGDDLRHFWHFDLGHPPSLVLRARQLVGPDRRESDKTTQNTERAPEACLEQSFEGTQRWTLMASQEFPVYIYIY